MCSDYNCFQPGLQPVSALHRPGRHESTGRGRSGTAAGGTIRHRHCGSDHANTDCRVDLYAAAGAVAENPLTSPAQAAYGQY